MRVLAFPLIAAFHALALVPALGDPLPPKSAVFTISPSANAKSAPLTVNDGSQQVQIGVIDPTNHKVTLTTPNSAMRVGSSSDLQAFIVQPMPDRIHRDYFANLGDGGAADYVHSATACSEVNHGLQEPAADGGCWLLDRTGPLSVKTFGADGSYTRDSTAAFNAWWKACMAPQTNAYGGSGGTDCLIPAGHYKITSTLVWDFAANPGGGGRIHGEGMNASVLDFSSAPNSYLYIRNSKLTGWYYARFEDFGAYAANTTAGNKAAIQVNSDPVAGADDAANNVEFNHVYAGNRPANCDAGTAGMSINSFYAGKIDVNTYLYGCTENSQGAGTTANGGDSLRLNGVAYSSITGSFSKATNGIHITASAAAYTWHNTFLNPDIEVNYTAVLIDNQYVRENTFIGGQWVWCTTGTSCPSGTGYGVKATAGYGNTFLNPNVNLSPFTAPGSCDNGVQVISGGGPFGDANCTARWIVSSPSGSLTTAAYNGTAYLTNNASAGSNVYGVQTGNAHDFNVGNTQVANIGYWANGLQLAAPVTIASLPACGSTSQGTMAMVSNGKASPGYHEVLSTGATGAAVLPVYCIYSGSSYAWVY